MDSRCVVAVATVFFSACAAPHAWGAQASEARATGDDASDVDSCRHGGSACRAEQLPTDDMVDGYLSMLSLRGKTVTGQLVSEGEPADQAPPGSADVAQTVSQLRACLSEPLNEEGAAAPAEVQYLNGTSPGMESLARLHNLRVAEDMKPLAVVYARSRQEVAHAMMCAAQAGVPVSGQSGRHSYIAYCTVPCLLVNVFHMKEVHVDASSASATLGAGLNLGQAYTQLADHGFTIPGGTCPTVGLAGLTLGGGKGILTRLHGLLIDKLRGVDAVLYNGTYVHANSTHHPDLFWIARGGGGNTFPGIATSFHFELVKVPPMVTDFVADWPIAGERDNTHYMKGVRAVEVWQNHYLVHPDRRLHVRLTLQPYESTVRMEFKFLGIPREEAETFLAPALRELGQPLNGGTWTNTSYLKSVMQGGGIGKHVDQSCTKTWANGMTEAEAREEMLRPEPPFCSWDGQFNMYFKYRALVTTRLDRLAILKMMQKVMDAPYYDPKKRSWNFYLQIDPSNAAAADMPPEATAYPWRGREEMTLQVIAKYEQDDSWDGRNPTLESYNYLLIALLQPYAGTRSYYNYGDDDMPGGAVPLDAYFGKNKARVLQIRAKYANLALHGGDEWELMESRPGQPYTMQRVAAKPR